MNGELRKEDFCSTSLCVSVTAVCLCECVCVLCVFVLGAVYYMMNDEQLRKVIASLSLLAKTGDVPRQ